MFKEHYDYHGKLKKNDWYKAFVRIEPNYDDKIEKQLFPRVEF